jgi:hypothetical protein
VKRPRCGRVYQRGGRWWLDVTLGGVRVRRAAGTTRAAAERALRNVRAPARAGVLRWEDFEQLLRDDYRARNKPSSMRALEVRLHRLAQAFAGERVSAIAWRAVQSYVDRQQRASRAPSTIRGDCGLSRATAHLAGCGLAPVYPAHRRRTRTVPARPQLEPPARRDASSAARWQSSCMAYRLAPHVRADAAMEASRRHAEAGRRRREDRPPETSAHAPIRPCWPSAGRLSTWSSSVSVACAWILRRAGAAAA